MLVNTLKATDEEVLGELQKEKSVTFEPIPWCPHAFMAIDPSGVLTSHRLFAERAYYLQNPSSLIPVLALNPNPLEQILDIAAAPGGKTIHIACRMSNTGSVVANDVSKTRTLRMQRLLSAYGVTNVQVTCMPGQRLWEKQIDVYDRILVDAPCTMYGTSTPSTDNPKELIKSQRWLLRSAYSACKPGGIIVYSTCTTNVEENEEAVDWILQKETGNIAVEPISIPKLPVSAPLLKGTKGQDLDSQIGHTIRIQQTADMEGFYVAKLRKSVHPVKQKHI